MEQRAVFMPPLPNKSRGSIFSSAVDEKPVTASCAGMQSKRLGAPPQPPAGSSNGAFQPRFKGPPRPAQKRTIFAGLDALRPPAEPRGSLSIEGSRTGEEFPVEVQAPRKPPDTPPADLSALRRQLAQAKGEIRTLTAKLQKRKGDLDNAMHLMNLLLEELGVRREKEMEHLLEREQSVWKNLVAPLSAIDHSKMVRDAEEKKKELERMLKQQREAFELEKAALVAQLSEAQKTPKNDGEIDQLKARIAELEKQVELDRVRFAHEKQVLEAEKAGVEMVLSETSIKLHELEMKRAEEEFLVAQSRQFVKNVCQPGFNVVKDTSLEPVQKNRSSPTGFVLVPLIILLHGYTLLPNDDRQTVISSYERRAADL